MSLPLKKAIAIRYGRARVDLASLSTSAPSRQHARTPIALVAHRGVHRGRDGGGWLPPARETLIYFLGIFD